MTDDEVQAMIVNDVGAIQYNTCRRSAKFIQTCFVLRLTGFLEGQ
jgi:hypothetical protein